MYRTHRLSGPPRFAFLSVHGNRSFYPVELATYKSTFEIDREILGFHRVTNLLLLMRHAAVIILFLRPASITTRVGKASIVVNPEFLSHVLLLQSSRRLSHCSACRLLNHALPPWLAYRLLARVFGSVRKHSAVHESIRLLSSSERQGVVDLWEILINCSLA